MRLRFPLAILLLLATAFVAGLTALGLLANPQVPQGGSASFAASGTTSPANGQAWDVVNSASSIIATAAAPAGWSVSVSGSTFTVGAPSTATVAAGYAVRYGSSSVVVSPSNSPAPQATRAPAARGTTRSRSAPAPNGVASGGAWGRSGTTSAAKAMAVVQPQPAGAQSATFDVVAGTAGGGVPGAPTGVAVAGGTRKATVSWSAASGATAYTVKVGTASGSYSSNLNAGAATSLLVPNLTDGTKYYFVVAASNSVGASANSAEVSATPVDAPTGLAAAPGAGKVTLSWSAAVGATGYKIEYGTASGSYVFSTISSGTSATVQGLTGGTAYYFVVSGTNASAQSDRSSEVSATPSAGPIMPPDSVGTEFWLAVPGSGPSGGTGGGLSYSLYVTSAYATSGTVSVPGEGFSQSFTVSANGVATIALPTDIELSARDWTEHKAIHVVAGAPVGVQVLNFKAQASEGFSAIPVQALGTAYVEASYPSGYSSLEEATTMMAVVATQDGTTLTVTPSVSSSAHAAGTPFTVALNQGDAYQLEAPMQMVDPTGTVVRSDKPVAFFSGCQGANVPVNMPTLNPLTEGIPSVDRWGTDFAFVPLATRNGDVMRVVAAFNGTVVTVNGATAATLQQGGVYEAVVSSASAVSANKPVLVQQLSRGNGADGNTQADPFSVDVPALTQFVASATFAVPDASMFSASYVNVALPSSAIGDLQLDGATVPSSSFSALGSTGYSTARLSVAPGAHTLATPSTGAAFGATVYGFGYCDGYAYPAAIALPTNGATYEPPFAPTGLTAATVSTSEIDLAWTGGASGATGFRVERKTGASGNWAAVASLPASARSYSDTGLAQSTTYVYRVVATGDLDSAPSNEASATTQDPPPPTAPGSPSGLVATAVSSTQVNLSWTDNSNNETGFKVERLNPSTGAFEQIGIADAGATSYPDPYLTASTQYSYRVRATNGAGDSTYSNVASATTTATGAQLASIVLGTSGQKGGDSFVATVTLATAAPTGGQYVQIVCDIPGALSYPSSLIVPAGSDTATFTVSVPTSLIGERDPTLTAISGGVADDDTLTVLPALQLESEETGPSKVTLWWRKCQGAVGYNVYRSTSDSSLGVRVNGSPVTTPDSGPGVTNGYMFSDTGLSTGMTYYYRIAAVNASGNEFLLSDQDQGTPSYDAIPWDSGDPSQIVPLVRNLVNSGLPDSFGQVGALTAVGHDSVEYVGDVDGTYDALPATADYDLAANAYVYPNGQIQAPPHGASKRPGFPPRYKVEGAVYRKLESVDGEYGIYSTIGLPSEVALSNNNNSTNMYVGGHVDGGGGELDLGFMKNRNLNTSQLNPHWNMVANLGKADGGEVSTPNRTLDDTVGQLLAFQTKVWLGRGPDQTLALCYRGHVLDRKNRSIGGDAIVVHRKGWLAKNSTKFVMKRVNTIAQKLKPTDLLFNKKNPAASRYFYHDGDHAYYAFWGSPNNPSDDTVDGWVTLYPDGSWDDSRLARIGNCPPGGQTPYVKYLTQNDWFWEQNIYLDTRP